MNDLQKLLKLRKITVVQIAKASGEDYHSLQKTIKGIRQTPHIQETVAKHLGLRVWRTFGQQAILTIRGLIAQEIAKREQGYGDHLKLLFLDDKNTLPE